MKRVASLALTLALAVALFFLAGGARKADGEKAAPAAAAALRFHAPEQKGLPSPKPDPACSGCHKISPHEANPRARAFLNQHAGFMSCAVCHAQGPSVTLSRSAEGSATTALIGGKAVAPPAVSGRSHTLAGAAFAARPGDCRSCHSRGAAYFSNAAFYDEYRKGLLEDLDVLAAMEKAQ